MAGIGPRVLHPLRHQVLPLTAVPDLLDEERQPGDLRVERSRQPVAGVQVTQRVERGHQLGVEPDLCGHGFGRQLIEVLAQEAQPLHRIDGMHRPLQGQVHVGVGEQHDRLIDDQLAVLQRELS